MDQASFETKLEMYAKRMQEMQESTDYQTRMMDKCMQMRDRYKKQYQDLLKQTANNSGASSLRMPTSLNGSVVGGTDMMDVNDDAENTPCASTSGMSDVTSIADKERKIGSLEAKLKETEEQLKVLKEEYETYRKEKLTNDKMLNEQFDTFRAMIETADAAPTQSMLDVYASLESRLSAALTQWNALLKNEVPALDEAARKENLPLIVVKTE